jgi:hypothetical protein
MVNQESDEDSCPERPSGAEGSLFPYIPPPYFLTAMPEDYRPAATARGH